MSAFDGHARAASVSLLDHYPDFAAAVPAKDRSLAASVLTLDDCATVTLGDRFVVAARRWPGLWEVLLRRHAARADRLAGHIAALQHSRVDARLHAVLWQLADRFGRVTPRGVVLRLPLTHTLLGRLVAAKRPTVTLAVSELASSGAVVRLDNGDWLLALAAAEGDDLARPVGGMGGLDRLDGDAHEHAGIELPPRSRALPGAPRAAGQPARTSRLTSATR